MWETGLCEARLQAPGVCSIISLDLIYKMQIHKLVKTASAQLFTLHLAASEHRALPNCIGGCPWCQQLGSGGQDLRRGLGRVPSIHSRWGRALQALGTARAKHLLLGGNERKAGNEKH